MIIDDSILTYNAYKSKKTRRDLKLSPPVAAMRVAAALACFFGSSTRAHFFSTLFKTTQSGSSSGSQICGMTMHYRSVSRSFSSLATTVKSTCPKTCSTSSTRPLFTRYRSRRASQSVTEATTRDPALYREERSRPCGLPAQRQPGAVQMGRQTTKLTVNIEM